MTRRATLARRKALRALGVIALAQLLVMSLWFSATAAAPELAAAWNLTPTETAWLTIGVQLGFVTGALLSAAFTLSDVIQPRFLFAGSALFGAAVTIMIAGLVESAFPAIVLRFLTGVALAGVYPPGMKLMAGWFQLRRGLAIGVLVGALTVGSALPHLLRGLGGVGNPELVLYGAAGLAVVGGLLIMTVGEGPYQAPAAPFDPGAIGRILRDRGTLLANIGYFGHMWELYAVWTWIPIYLAASLATTGSVENVSQIASVLAFVMIAVGGPGAVVAGYVSDRLGRTITTTGCMVISGTACLAAGLMFGSSVHLTALFVLVWGVAIVADSAQFSACVTELSEPEYVGTALTVQTAVGFLLTTVSIQLIPLVAGSFGWRWAFAPLIIGPMIGIVAMRRLRALPDSKQLAGGRR